MYMYLYIYIETYPCIDRFMCSIISKDITFAGFAGFPCPHAREDLPRYSRKILGN